MANLDFSSVVVEVVTPRQTLYGFNASTVDFSTAVAEVVTKRLSNYGLVASNIQLTSLVVEVATQTPPPNLQVSQVVLEVLAQNITVLNVTADNTIPLNYDNQYQIASVNTLDLCYDYGGKGTATILTYYDGEIAITAANIPVAYNATAKGVEVIPINWELKVIGYGIIPVEWQLHVQQDNTVTASYQQTTKGDNPFAASYEGTANSLGSIPVGESSSGGWATLVDHIAPVGTKWKAQRLPAMGVIPQPADGKQHFYAQGVTPLATVVEPTMQSNNVILVSADLTMQSNNTISLDYGAKQSNGSITY